jgi:hypothetical protein
VAEQERTQLRLSLIENAYDSFAESLGYVERAITDPSRWKFAVLNLVHAVELVLKQRLVDEHELLIWQDVDRPGSRTVSLDKAIQRLATARVAMDDGDVQAIQTAIRWRNNITHYEVDLVAEEVRENYLLIFEFLDKFHEAHFPGSLSGHIPDEHVQTAMDLAESFQREFIEFRGRSVHRRWARKLVAAQRTTFLELEGVKYPRVVYGSEDFWDEDYMKDLVPKDFCRDCAAAIGEYHGPGCVVEECPNDHGQLFGCECDWEPSELWALDDWPDEDEDEDDELNAEGDPEPLKS